MNKLKYLIANLLDLFFVPITFLSTLWLRIIRRIGISRTPASRFIFRKVGIYPISDHFYEPLYHLSQLSRPLHTKRNLSGIDWNMEEQMSILNRFNYSEELMRFPMEKVEANQYWFNNVSFGPGDSEYLYSIIRLFKPERIIEVGSGFSTLMTLAAVAQNRKEDKTYNCIITCIEPYLQPWLEKLEIDLVRKRVENVDHRIFEELKANDILFLDSSHIIRPQGDVNDLYLEVLPVLKPGVLVHSHDIFTPDDYPERWFTQLVRMWNEQYLLEAFLSFNHDFRIIGSLHFLSSRYPDALCEKCPVLRKVMPEFKPGSFWIARNR